MSYTIASVQLLRVWRFMDTTYTDNVGRNLLKFKATLVDKFPYFVLKLSKQKAEVPRNRNIDNNHRFATETMHLDF